MSTFDVYSAVSDRIIQQLEQGLIPWQKPWTGVHGGAYSAATGKPYSLLNQMILRKPGAYYTFSEVQKRGGHIRKGEKSSFVVFWKQVAVKEFDPDTGEEREKLVPMLRYYNVFHASQCEGLPAEALQEPTEQPTSPAADKVISDYLSRENLTLTLQRGDEAYYSPVLDRVVVPLREQFPEIAEYYSTCFHELTHSTGHSSRLNRLNATAHFGSESYSKEELIAEIGAAALMNYTGTETVKAFRNSSAYIQSWLRTLRNDKRLIVIASGAASKAVNYILSGAV